MGKINKIKVWMSHSISSDIEKETRKSIGKEKCERKMEVKKNNSPHWMIHQQFQYPDSNWNRYTNQNQASERCGSTIWIFGQCELWS